MNQKALLSTLLLGLTHLVYADTPRIAGTPILAPMGNLLEDDIPGSVVCESLNGMKYLSMTSRREAPGRPYQQGWAYVAQGAQDQFFPNITQSSEG